MATRQQKINSTTRRFHLLGSLWFWLVLLITMLAGSLCLGSVSISLADLLHPTGSVYTILVHVRIPRTIGCLAAGSALAVSGFIIQSVLANSLAAPNTIGIQSGAGLMIALCSALFPYAMNLQMPAAFIGSLMSAILILALAYKTRSSKTTVILAGVAISQIFSAGIDLIVTLYPDALNGYTNFKIGGLSGVTISKMLPGLILILAALVLVLLCSRQLEVLTLGMETAQSLGLNSRRWSMILLALACALAGSVISFAGMIGFVGLIVPHLVKRTIPGNAARLLIGCILQGAVFMLLCDILARVLFAPFEIPTGILLSLAGGPYFLWLLFHMRSRK